MGSALEAVLNLKAQETARQKEQSDQLSQAVQVFQNAKQQAVANQFANLQYKAGLADKGLKDDGNGNFTRDESLQSPLERLITAGKVGEAAKTLNLPNVYQAAQQSVGGANPSNPEVAVNNPIASADATIAKGVDAMNQKDVYGEYTPQAKIAQEVEKQRQMLEGKSKVPTAQQKNDLTATENQIQNIKLMKDLASKVPAGRIAGSISGLISSATGGEFDTETRQYLKQRPAYAVSIYRALTGDTRLSDADAKARALPLLWHPTESKKIRESSFSTIENALQARKKLIEQGKYSQDADGQFITPLEDVLAEAETAGTLSGGSQTFTVNGVKYNIPSDKVAAFKKAKGL